MRGMTLCWTLSSSSGQSTGTKRIRSRDRSWVSGQDRTAVLCCVSCTVSRPDPTRPAPRFEDTRRCFFVWVGRRCFCALDRFCFQSTLCGGNLDTAVCDFCEVECSFCLRPSSVGFMRVSLHNRSCFVATLRGLPTGACALTILTSHSLARPVLRRRREVRRPGVVRRSHRTHGALHGESRDFSVEFRWVSEPPVFDF